MTTAPSGQRSCYATDATGPFLQYTSLTVKYPAVAVRNVANSSRHMLLQLTVRRSSCWAAACDILHTAVGRGQRGRCLGTEKHLHTITRTVTKRRVRVVASLTPGADLVTPWRGSLFHVISMRVTKLFRCRFVPLLEPNPGDATAPVSPDPLNARSLGFPKSPPSKTS